MAKKRIPEKVKKKVKEYVDILREDSLPIGEVWLFGSYARGAWHKWSDIDVCVVSPKFKNSFDATQYLWQKRIFDMDLTVEPLGYSPKDFKEGSSLIEEIRKEGIRLNL